MILIFDLES